MINVDPAELDKFNQLAHRWWDPNSEFKPLHEINPLRLDYIDSMRGFSGKRAWWKYHGGLKHADPMPT